MGVPHGRGVEASIRLEDTTDLGECLGHVRQVVEHVVGDDGVEAVIHQGDRLRVDHLKAEAPGPVSQVLLGVLEHARRKVGQDNRPAIRDPAEIGRPKVGGAATQLEDLAPGWQREPLVDPTMPAKLVGAETLVDREPRVQVGRVPILFGQVAGIGYG